MPHGLARRLLLGALTIALVLTATFFALHAAPGDPALLFLGPSADQSALDAVRREAGLDRPAVVQYLDWLRRFALFDWGTSLAQRRPVTSVLGSALSPTILLVGLSLSLSWLAGLAIGLVQAARRGSRLDTALTAITTLLQSLPSYVLGLGLVLVFAYGAALGGWPEALRLPAFGAERIGAEFLPPAGRLADRLRHLVLPVVTLALIGAAGSARYARAATAEALRQPFIRTARAKGLAEGRVLRRHALRAALVPLITLIGLQLPALFSGAVFVEAIFAWPGMGRVAVEAVQSRDYPVVMAVTAVFATLVVLGNLVADALTVVADPRQRSAS